jgi:hypothetical protein
MKKSKYHSAEHKIMDCIKDVYLFETSNLNTRDSWTTSTFKSVMFIYNKHA